MGAAYLGSQKANSDDRKKRAELLLRLQARGYEVKSLGGDALIVTRWGLSRVLRDKYELESFVQAVGA